MDSGRAIVVVGGGFAATTLVKHLEGKLPPDASIVLISDQPAMTYTPLLSEVVSASIVPMHAVAPLRRIKGTCRYIHGRVVDVDAQSRRVVVESSRRLEMAYDQLVLAVGVDAKLDLFPGLEQHALPIKSVGDALHLRNRVLERLEAAQLTEDTDIRRALLHFVIIGGGSSGAEAAGAIDDLLSAASRYYPDIESSDWSVELIEMGDRLLPEFHPNLGEAAKRNFERRGIKVRLNTQAEQLNESELVLQSGERIRSHNVVNTVGFAPPRLIEDLSLPKRKGLLEVEPDMSVPGHSGIWAIGDCAVVPNEAEEGPSPPTAQYAVRQGRQLAGNIRRRLAGEQTRPFSYRSLGQLATVGHRRAVAQVLGLRASGFVAWLLWRAYYLARVPTFLRKVQVFLQWNLDLLFPPDITPLNLARSSPQGPARRQVPADKARERRAAGDR